MSHHKKTHKNEKELEFLEKMREEKQTLPHDKIPPKDKDNRMQRKEDLNTIADFENQMINEKKKLNPKRDNALNKEVKGLEKDVKNLGTFDSDSYVPASKEQKRQIAEQRAEKQNKERRKRKSEIEKKGHKL